MNARASSAMRRGGAVIVRFLIFAMVAVVKLGASEVVHFLVAERYPFLNDSFVLPVAGIQNVAEARAQLSTPMSERDFVVGRVVPGADGTNRNLVVSGKPRWSWHVEFLGFAGVTALPEADPAFIEDNLDWWMDLTEGLSAFLRYTVVRELTLEDLFLVSIEPGGDGVSFRWLNLGTNYVYTVERSDELNPAIWTVAPGTWPIEDHDWIDSSPVARWRYYRVRAERTQP